MLEQFELATLIENDLDEYVSIYLSQPKLSKEEREVLYEKILNGDEEAKNQLLLSYLKYPIIMAKRCAKDIDEFKDYLHAGNLALFGSLESFSYKKGACFTRYLNFQIRKEITKVIAGR